MEVRQLDRADRSRAIAIWEARGLTRPWNDPVADFDRAVDGPSSTIFGAFDGDDLCATVMTGHDGHRGWVYYLAVDKDRAHQGLGRLMMATAEQWLRDRDVPKLHLMVRHSNREVISFYEHLDYEDAQTTVMARWL